jgi:uncharacterized LabA/DUF88 family protein
MTKPYIGRMMIFIDGENLTFRYQAMLEKGWISKSDVIHIKDQLVWHGAFTMLTYPYHVLRATYYTYTVGDEDYLYELNKKIKALTFDQYRPGGNLNLTPMVFKKKKQNAKAKGVDIQLTVDMLSHVHHNNLDAVYLLSGDGDYKPLIEEVLRSGKQVFLSAFSDGLNPSLENIVDGFYCLDAIAFSSKPPNS